MKFLTSRLFCSFLLLFSTLSYAALADINRIYHQQPALNAFEICQGGGCVVASKLSLSDAEWRQVSQLFNPAATGAEDERKKISLAIGLLEEIVGKKIGTSNDLAGTFDSGSLSGQQDCNDEAINSTTYMRLLRQAGYLKFHEIEDMRTRNFFFTGWPHTTAVIHEVKTGARFAVDSWFYDNGHPATIVPFEQWKDNYQPKDSPIGKTRTFSQEATKH